MAATKISPAEKSRRHQEVEGALASVRLEGLEPSDPAKRLFQRFADGELSSAELDDAFDAYLDAEYGPIRLPRDQRS